MTSKLSIGAHKRVMLAVLLTAGMLLGMLALSAQRAHAALYFPLEGGRYIAHAGNNGLGGALTVETGGRATGVAVDGPYLYWLNDPLYGEPGSLDRSTLDGTEVTTLVSGLEEPEAIAIEGEYIYYGQSGATNEIGRVKLDGEDAENAFIATDVSTPAGLAVNASHIYWTNLDKEEGAGDIADANINGGEVKIIIETATSGKEPRGLAVDSSYLYWGSAEIFGSGSSDRIGRANLEGQDPEPEFIEEETIDGTFALGIDSTDSHLYWSSIFTPSYELENNYGRATLNGSGAATHVTGEFFTEEPFFGLGVREGAYGIASNALRGTKITLTCDSTSPHVGREMTCTATDEDVEEGTASPPTGPVEFKSEDPAATFGEGGSSCTLAATGAKTSACSITYVPGTATPAGAKEYEYAQLIAESSDDSVHASGYGKLALKVAAADTSKTTLTCAPESLPAGASSNCTATVTDTAASGASEPTGTVSFVSSNAQGAFNEASCTLAGNGDGTSSSCAVSYGQSETGSPELTASFGGGGGVAASEGKTTLTFTERTTELSLNCEPQTRAVTLSTTCTARVSDNSEGTPVVPTGSVSFVSNDSEGSFSEDSCTLVSEENGTSASCAVEYSQPDLGEPTIEASYAGDASHTGATAEEKLDFTRRATSTTIECEPASLTVDDGSTSCKATVTDVESGGTPNVPTGTVEFTSENTAGAFSPTSCTLAANGNVGSSSCAVEYIQTEAGSPTITGAYSGDTNESPSSGSGSVTFQKRSTTTELSCSPSEPKLKTETTCTVTVKDTAEGTASAPKGTVSFTLDGDGTFNPSTRECTLSEASASSSTCTFGYTPTFQENPEIIAKYTPAAGDEHEGSEGSYVVHVGYPLPHETETAVVCTPTSPAAGTATSCTATVTDPHAEPYPATGTVSFAASGSGAFHPESCSLNPSGTASSSCKVSYTPSTAGEQTITASYEGSAASEPSEGDTSITASGPHSTSTVVSCTPSSLQTGTASICTATVTDTSGSPVSPSGTVEFSASDGGAIAPAGCTLVAKGSGTATCSVTYTPKAAGSDTVTATLLASDADSTSSGSTVLTVSAPPAAPVEVKPAPAPVPTPEEKAPQPSNVFTFGKVTLHKQLGTATVRIKLPDAGKLVLSGTGVKRVSGSAKGKATVKVTLKLTGKALKQLESKHRDKVKFTVKFTPTSGTARTKKKTVTLILSSKKAEKKGKR